MHQIPYCIICFYAIKVRQIPDTCFQIQAKKSDHSCLQWFQIKDKPLSKSMNTGWEMEHLKKPTRFPFGFKKFCQFSWKTKYWQFFLSVYENSTLEKILTTFFSVCFCLISTFRKYFFFHAVLKEESTNYSVCDVWRISCSKHTRE